MDNKKNDLILESMRKVGLPVGATFLSKQHALPPATIGRILFNLEQQGLIEKMSNKGRIVTQKGRDYLLEAETHRENVKNASRLAQLATKNDKNTLLEILQIRKLLEGYTAELACANAKDSDIENLERLMLEHLHLIRSGELGSCIDLEIHLTIAEISGNKTLHQILKVMLTGDNVYTKFSFVSDKVKHTQIKQHDAIIQAIRDRAPERARTAMETHLSQVMSDLENYYE